MRKATVFDFTHGPPNEGAAESICVARSMPPEDVIRLVQSTGVRHLVQKDGMAYDTELAAARVMIERPKEFLDHPTETIFGLGEAAGHLPFLQTKSDVSEHKNVALLQFDNFLQALSGSRTIRDYARLIADELYTNGAKNAWPPGVRPPASGMIRTGAVEFFARSDGQRLVIGCRDTFGELALSRVLSRIQTCYQNGVAQSINHGEGGAGIGSFLVFSNCISYYAGVERGRRTVVCVALPLGITLRESSSLAKNIHLVSIA